MLVSFSPHSMESLAIRVVEDALANTLVVLEGALVYLTIWPEKLTISALFSQLPLTFVDSTVWPDKETVAVHVVFVEASLVDLTLASYGSSVSMRFTIFKVALVE